MYNIILRSKRTVIIYTSLTHMIIINISIVVVFVVVIVTVKRMHNVL
jgi:hypothetical protein